MKGWALAAVLAFLWANRSGCCWLAGHSPYTVRKALPPAAAAGPAPAPPPELRVLFFADFGDNTCQQASVAKSMAAANARAPFDLAFSAGDNLYECGPDARIAGAAACAFAADGNTVAPGFTAPDDPRFRKHFEDALAPLQRDGRPLPVYLALGNHDVRSDRSCAEGDVPLDRLGRLRACLEVAHHAPHWDMPARHYVIDRGPARFIVVDSNVIGADYGGFTLEQEEAFVAQATVGCDARPCFLVGHHPPAAAGEHAGALLGEGNQWVPRMRRIQEAARGPIAAYFGGHDHDLQHLRAAAGYDVFVAGNGSRWRDEKFTRVGPIGAQLFFASTAWGFATLEVSARHWSVRFQDDQGEPLDCCQADFPGACQPVACGPAPSGPTVPAAAAKP